MPSLLPISPPPRPITKEPDEPDYESWPISRVEAALDKLIGTDDAPDKWRSLFLSVNPQPLQVS